MFDSSLSILLVIGRRREHERLNEYPFSFESIANGELNTEPGADWESRRLPRAVNATAR